MILLLLRPLLEFWECSEVVGDQELSVYLFGEECAGSFSLVDAGGLELSLGLVNSGPVYMVEHCFGCLPVDVLVLACVL